MAFFSKKNNGSKSSKKVVVTGKRIKGTWVMESTLKPKSRRSKRSDVILETENRRVRTLH